jgi:hypothetical protein
MLLKRAYLDSWVNPEYVAAFRDNRLSSWRSDKPFAHAVLPNFLRSEAIQAVLDHCSKVKVERSHRMGLAGNADWYWGAFSHLDYLRFFLSHETRAFLGSLMDAGSGGGTGADVTVKIKPGAVPQFNIFRPGSPGIPVHTDLNEMVGLVTLLYLSDDFDGDGGGEDAAGGELVFYRREGDAIVPDKIIPPACNTLAIFHISENSYHSVEDMRGRWTRRTITYDFLADSASR